MVDVTRMPTGSFGYVPTPALVAPIEFTMRTQDYADLGGHLDSVVTLDEVAAVDRTRAEAWREDNPWPLDRRNAGAT